MSCMCNGNDNNGISTYTLDAYMFLASAKEVRLNFAGYQYASEGVCFDYFVSGQPMRVNLMNTVGLSSRWWLRTAYSENFLSFYLIPENGYDGVDGAAVEYSIMLCFVVG